MSDDALATVLTDTLAVYDDCMARLQIQRAKLVAALADAQSSPFDPEAAVRAPVDVEVRGGLL